MTKVLLFLTVVLPAKPCLHLADLCRACPLQCIENGHGRVVSSRRSEQRRAIPTPTRKFLTWVEFEVGSTPQIRMLQL